MESISAGAMPGAFGQDNQADNLDEFDGEREKYLREKGRELSMRPEDVDVFLRAGVPLEKIPINKGLRRSQLKYLRKNETTPPNWMMMTGLFPEVESRGNDRRRRLRHLHKIAVGLIRRELMLFEKDPLKAERTIFWEPAVEVCRWLELSSSKLSAMLKEFNGNSLSQTIDCVKAEVVRKKMREGLKDWLTQRHKDTKNTKGEEGGKDDREKKELGASLGTGKREEALEIWKEIRKERRWPEFSQNTWANELGFASYRKLYRACLAVFRKTPYQIELELIGELLAEKEFVADFHEYTFEEIEEEVRGYRPVDWEKGSELKIQN